MTPVLISAESTWPAPIIAEPATTAQPTRVAARLSVRVDSSSFSTSSFMVNRSSASLPRMMSVRRGAFSNRCFMSSTQAKTRPGENESPTRVTMTSSM